MGPRGGRGAGRRSASAAAGGERRRSGLRRRRPRRPACRVRGPGGADVGRPRKEAPPSVDWGRATGGAAMHLRGLCRPQIPRSLHPRVAAMGARCARLNRRAATAATRVAAETRADVVRAGLKAAKSRVWGAVSGAGGRPYARVVAEVRPVAPDGPLPRRARGACATLTDDRCGAKVACVASVPSCSRPRARRPGHAVR